MFPRIQNPSHDAGRVLTCYQSPRLLYDTLDLKGSCSQPEKTGHAPFHISWVQATQGDDLDPANEGLGFNFLLPIAIT